MNKLPESLVQDLNNIGLGGRLVYVPLVRRTISDEIYEAMISMLKAGESINLDKFQNLVSLRTLYRLKTRAIKNVEHLRKEG